MRGLLLTAFLLAPAAAESAVTFVSPAEGAQAIGPQLLEVTTGLEDIDRVEFFVDGTLVGVARTSPWRVVHDFGTSVSPRLIRAKALSDRYRRTDTAERVTASLTSGGSVTVDLVEVPLQVRSSRPLRAADIRVRENAVDQTVRDILASRGAAHFAFVVDRSLSMSGGRLAAALAAVDGAMSRLRRGDTASLILFNHHVARPVRLRRRGDASALVGTVPSGGTSLRDAATFGVIDAGSARTYVVLITDGGDRNSLLSEEEALRAISGARTVVSGILLGDSSPFLDRASRATGGTVLRATSRSVAQQVERLLDDINSRYTVVYQSRGNGQGWRTIEVAPRRRGIEVVSARKRYFAE